MSEQKTASFMQELGRWTEATIIDALAAAANVEFDQGLVEQIKKSIRTKVLESYRNGQKAGIGPAKYPQKGGR